VTSTETLERFAYRPHYVVDGVGRIPDLAPPAGTAAPASAPAEEDDR